MTSWQDAEPGSFAVLGDPVSHSLSPAMHNANFGATGLDYVYCAFRVPLEEFDRAVAHLAQLGYLGVNCTVPLKEAAFAWCQSRGGVESSAVTLNTLDLVHGRGTNTDVPAFLSTLCSFCPGRKVLVLGAGGTARALVPALVREGYEVAVWNRTPERLVAVAGVRAMALPEAAGFHVVVNTTSAGLRGEAPPVVWEGSEAVAYDVGYSGNGLTPFLEQAARHGRSVQDGRAMLVEQGALSFEWWTGKMARRDVMTEAIQCP